MWSPTTTIGILRGNKTLMKSHHFFESFSFVAVLYLDKQAVGNKRLVWVTFY